MIMQERPYLSIGEVLGLLLEEFPDVTISKIRFLESQGLIDPERTASGYRKFYDNDVDLLRVILREQRENFLPLRVIRDRLESGAIEDPTGPTTPPRGIRNVTDVDEPDVDEPRPRPVSDRRTRHGNHPSAQHGADAGDDPGIDDVAPQPMTAPATVADVDHRHDSFAAGESVPSLAGLTASQLAELESYGLLAGKGSGDSTLYTAGRPGHRSGGRRIHASRRRRPAPSGLAPGRRTRGVAVRADDPAAAAPTQPAGATAGSRRLSRRSPRSGPTCVRRSSTRR